MKLLLDYKQGTIKPKPISGLDCMEVCVVNILYYLKKAYEFTFFETFNFQFVASQSSIIGPNVSAGKIHILEYANQFFGLCIQNYEKEKENTAFTIIQTDIHKCIWLPEYQRMGTVHFLILIDRDTNQFICIDPTYINKYIVLNCCEFNLICDDLYQVSVPPSFKTTTQILEETVKLFTRHIQGLDLETAYQSFIQKMETLDTLENEFSDRIPFLKSIEYLTAYLLPGNRTLFQSYLRKLNEYQLLCSYDTLSELINSSISIWQSLKMNFLKIKYSHSYSTSKNIIIKKLKRIMNIEVQIHHLLENQKFLEDIFNSGRE